MPFVFKGFRSQRGFGPGSFFRKALNWVAPRFKTVAKSLAPYAKSFALNSASDLLEGQRGFKNILKRRAVEGGQELQRDLLKNVQNRLKQEGKGLINKASIESSRTMLLPIGMKRRQKRRVVNSLRRIQTKTKRKIKRKKQLGGGRRRKKSRRRRRKRTRRLKSSNHLFE